MSAPTACWRQGHPVTPAQRKVLDFLASCQRSTTTGIGRHLYEHATYSQRYARAEQIMDRLLQAGLVERRGYGGLYGLYFWVLTDAGKAVVS